MIHSENSPFKTVAGQKIAAPHTTNDAPPVHPLPEGATDCHLHIFSNQFPTASGKPCRQNADVDAYRKLMLRLGLSRCVLVAPSTYSQSNDCLLDGLEQFGDAARGVAILPPDVQASVLRDLNRHGVRGSRFYFNKLAQDTADTIRFGSMAADLDWHMEFVATPADRLLAAEKMLQDLPCKVVIDHFGHVPQPAGVTHPAADALLRLLEAGRVWIKLSAPYRSSLAGFPDYEDLDELAQRFIQTRPDRILWGTDWPHSGHEPPDAAKWADRVADWTQDASIRHKIFVDNPTEVYWS